MAKCISETIVLLYLFFLCNNVNVQNGGGVIARPLESDCSDSDLEVCLYADKMPEYRGKFKNYDTDFFNRFEYEDGLNGETGTSIIICFIITDEGKLCGTRALSSYDGKNIVEKKPNKLEQAAICAFNKIQTWSPGESNGKAVDVMIYE